MQRKKYLGSGLIDQIINNYDDQDYFDADEGNKTSKWDKSDEQCKYILSFTVFLVLRVMWSVYYN